MNNTPQLISITANFHSDSDNVTIFPEFGALPESGELQDMSNAFAKIVPGGGHPAFALPANLIIKAQSEIDIIPEPSIGLLLGCGLLVFVARVSAAPTNYRSGTSADNSSRSSSSSIA
jgi:hypothetical protein